MWPSGADRLESKLLYVQAPGGATVGTSWTRTHRQRYANGSLISPYVLLV